MLFFGFVLPSFICVGDRLIAPFREAVQFFLPSLATGGGGSWDAVGSLPDSDPHGGVAQVRNLYIRVFGRGVDEGSLFSIESPVAQYDSASSQFVGTDFVHVRGNLFTALGNRWIFFGGERRLVLDSAVQAFLEIDGGAESEDILTEGGRTVVGGQSLQIDVKEGAIFLRFRQDVSLRSGGFLLCSDELVVEIAREEPMRILDQEFAGEAIRSVRAAGAVRVEWPARSATADSAQIFPGEGVIFLSGNVNVLERESQIRCQGLLFRSDQCHTVAEEGICLEQVLQFLNFN
ncbi:MAG: hypothetical protein LBF24_00330 [Puniceicoccales bacterium]|nr:hypothetical protein [Puniceicoccales bacterium]